MESASDVQVVEAQVGTSQTIQRVENSLILESGDTTMGKALEVTVPDSGLGLPAFLAYFNLLEFNSLPTNHFHHFGVDLPCLM